jgi:hypothetical protein
MPFDAYASLPGVNSSRLKLIAKSPAHYLANPSLGNRKTLNYGEQYHCALLEPEHYLSRYAVAPVGATDRRRKAYKDWTASLPPGVRPVTQAEHRRIWGAAKEAEADPMLARFFGPEAKTEREICIFWNDEESGLSCKCRIDLFADGVGVLDVKTAASCTVDDFPWAARRYGYFEQLAFYRRGVRAAQAEGLLPSTGADVPLYILAQELDGAQARALYAIPDFEVTHFDAVISERLEVVRQCAESDTWAGPNGLTGAPIPLSYPGRLDFEDDEESGSEVELDWS